MKLENLNGQKLIEPIYFCFLKEKFLFWGKGLKFSLKQGFLTSCFFFYPKMVPKRVLCDSPKSNIINISGKNQVVSWLFFMELVFKQRQHLKKQYFDRMLPGLLFMQSDCMILWLSISWERIKLYLSFLCMQWVIKGR